MTAQARVEAERIVAAGQAAADRERAARDMEIAALLRRRADISRQLRALREVLGSVPDDDDDDEVSSAPSAPAAQMSASPPVAPPPVAVRPAESVAAALSDTGERASVNVGDRAESSGLRLLRPATVSPQEVTRQS